MIARTTSKLVAHCYHNLFRRSSIGVSSFLSHPSAATPTATVQLTFIRSISMSAPSSASNDAPTNSPSRARSARAAANSASVIPSSPSSATATPSKRKKSVSAGAAAAADSTDASATQPVAMTDDATTQPKVEEQEEQVSKKSRARSPSASSKAKMKRAQSAVEPAAAASTETKEEEAAPVAKKGRSKSAAPAVARNTSSSKKKSVSSASAGGSQDGEDGEEGGSKVSSEAAAALAIIEAAKRAARPANSTTIMCWNVNGLRAAIRNGANEYLRQIDADVIALCEVKADDDTVKKDFDNVGEAATSAIAAAFSGAAPAAATYYKFWNCCKTKKGYSGTAIFSKVKPISVTYGIGHAKHDDEGRTITAEFEKYYLVCTYVPNSGQKLERLSYRTTEWDKDLLEYLMTLQAKKPIIWTGDLNVAHHDKDIHNPKTNQKSAGFTKEERANFNSLVTEKKTLIDVYETLYPDELNRFTYWGHRFNSRSTNKGWRLDYFLVSPDLMEKKVVLDTWIGSELSEGSTGVRRSDHAPIFLNLM